VALPLPLTLPLTLTRDRFVAGDGLARNLAAVVRRVEWRRHRCASEEGQLVRSGAAEEAYVPTADDVGAMLSASWRAADGLRLCAETSHVQVARRVLFNTCRVAPLQRAHPYRRG